MPDVPTIFPEEQGKLLGDVGLPDILPSSIADDETMRLIATAIEAEIHRHVQVIPSTLLWAAINILKEPLLTHLAVMLHADWWDNAWGLAEKRAFLFRQVLLHRKKGTAWAVEEAVSIVYGQADVREWYEYGGDRGCFSLEVSIHDEGMSEDLVRKIELMVEKFKRKSQHLCAVQFSLSCPGTVFYGGTVIADELLTIYQYAPTELDIAQSSFYTAAALDMLEIYTLNSKS